MWEAGRVVLDEYKVVRELGSGAVAIVYLVGHVDRQTRLAAKVLRRRLAESTECRAAFAREAQVWMALPRHPHIVQCFFVRDVKDSPVVFAEYVPAGTLGQWRKGRRFRNLAHVLDLGIQISEAMLVAHQLGLIHQDLKPGNCLMDKAGRVKVADFGLAAAPSRAAGSGRVVAGGGFRGTQEYCSPEQLGGKETDSRTDIWSFAVLLFEMLCGARPTFGPAAPAAVRKHLATYGPGAVPADLWDLLLTLLEPDLARRPGSFAEVADGLRHCYRRVAGRPYQREFPDLFASGGPVASISAHRRDKAIALMKRALRELGRDASQADQFVADAPGGGVSDSFGVVSILAETARLYDRAVRDNPSPTRRRMLVNLLQGLATVQRQMGNLTGAVQAYDEAIRQMETIRRDAAASPIDPTLRLALAGLTQDRAVCLRQLGNAEGAAEQYERAAKWMGDGEDAGEAPIVANARAGVFQNRAMALLKSRRLADAIQEANRAVQTREELAQRPDGAAFLLDLAGSYLDRAVVHRQMGRTDAAIADYGRCLELADRPEARGQMVRREDLSATARSNRAAAYLSQGNSRAALGDCDLAIAELERWRQSGEPDKHSIPLAQAYNNRANARRLLGDIDGALRDMDQCVRLRKELVEERGRNELAGDLARAYSSQALCLIESGRAQVAWPIAERAARWLRAMVSDHGRRDLAIDLARIEFLRGLVDAAMDRAASACDKFADALRQYENLLDTLHADVVVGLVETMELYVRTAKQRELADRGLPIWASVLRRLCKAAGKGAAVPGAAQGRLRMIASLVRFRRGDASAAVQDIRAAVDKLLQIAARP